MTRAPKPDRRVKKIQSTCCDAPVQIHLLNRKADVVSLEPGIHEDEFQRTLLLVVYHSILVKIDQIKSSLKAKYSDRRMNIVKTDQIKSSLQAKEGSTACWLWELLEQTGIRRHAAHQANLPPLKTPTMMILASPQEALS